MAGDRAVGGEGGGWTMPESRGLVVIFAAPSPL